MRLSSQTNNAVKVLVFCARSDSETVTVPEIAAACDITEFNVFKLVPLLVKAGMMLTIRGRGGGVRLRQSPHEISIGKVVRATETLFQPVQADVPESDADEPADYPSMVDGAFLAFVEFLDQKTIADLAGIETSQPERKPGGPADRPRQTAIKG